MKKLLLKLTQLLLKSKLKSKAKPKLKQLLTNPARFAGLPTKQEGRCRKAPPFFVPEPYRKTSAASGLQQGY